MASLTNPHEGTTATREPSLGIITFSGKDGKFSVYFPAQRDAQGNVTKDAATVPLRFPRFMVVSVGFFRIVGGKPDRKDRSKFIGVSSPIVCSDKGYKWSQLIPVWVGRDSRTPDFYGTWSEIKEKVESKGGRYAELLFVVTPEFPDKLLLLELTGYSISQLKDAVKLFNGSNFTSSLVNGAHVLEMVNTDAYDIDGREFLKPVFQVSAFTKANKGYDQLYPVLVEFSRQVDDYGDALAAKQKSGDLTNGGDAPAQQPLPAPDSVLGAPQSRQEPANPYVPSEEPGWNAGGAPPATEPDSGETSYTDDLPF